MLKGGRKMEFQKYSSDLGQFSILMPGVPQQTTFLDISNRKFYHFTSQQEDISYRVIYHDYVFINRTIFDTDRGIVYEEATKLLPPSSKGQLYSALNISLNNYCGRAFKYKIDNQIVYGQVLLIKDKLYQLLVMVDKEKDLTYTENINRFLNSFRIETKKGTISTEDTTIDGLNIKDTFDPTRPLEEADKLKKNAPPKDEPITLAPELIKKIREVDKIPNIMTKPKPKYTEIARRNRIEGVVFLLVVFSIDKTIKNIKVVRGLGYGLEEEAIKATHQITFTPGQKDGQEVNVSAGLEYSFSLL